MLRVSKLGGETKPGEDISFASVEQADELTRISLVAKAHWGYTPDFLEACLAELTITKEQIADPKNIFLVKSVAGEVVGFAFVMPLTDDAASLDSLFILPESIGRGYGSELLDAVKPLAKKFGYKKLIIDSDPNAAGFYEKNGAVKIGEIPSGSIEGRFLPQYELLL